MDWVLKSSDAAVVIATLLGPILAIQTQKIIERRSYRTERRVAIFRTLMATRAMNLSAAHIEALNAIPIEFYGKSKSLVTINESWKSYLAHLNKNAENTPFWLQTRIDLLNDLLVKISNFCGYKFTHIEIKNELYFPLAQVDLQSKEQEIRDGVYKLLRGETNLAIEIKAFPPNPTSTENPKDSEK